MEKLLTVIVPSYNMEKYLARALDSLLIDDAHLFSLLDVIVVNDGSKDRTSEIAHRYAEKYPDVFRVIDKENGHYGSCVNVGIAEAKGRYVRILDADDSFDKDAFKVLLFRMSSLPDEIDAILTDVVEECEGKSFGLTRRHPFADGQVMTVSDLLSKRYVLSMQAEITVRVSLLRKICYRQTEGVAHSDMEWTCLPIACSERIVNICSTVYRYTTGREGQSIDPELVLENIWMEDLILKNEWIVYRKWREKLGLNAEWLKQQALSVTEWLFNRHLSLGYSKQDDLFWDCLNGCRKDMPWIKSLLDERNLFTRTPFRWHYCLTAAKHKHLRGAIFAVTNLYPTIRRCFSRKNGF